MPIKARNVPLSSPFLVSFFLSLSSLVLVHISIFMVMLIFVAFICVLPCILTLYSCSVAAGCLCVCVGFVFFLISDKPLPLSCPLFYWYSATVVITYVAFVL